MQRARKKTLQDELREIEQAIADCARDLYDEAIYSIILFNDEHTQSVMDLINEAALERKQIWEDKEYLLGKIEEQHVIKRRLLATGIMCSVGVATLIAEFLTGPMGSDTTLNFVEDFETLYALSIALRVDGTKWPYLTYYARKRMHMSGETRDDDFAKIARPVLGEFCRLYTTLLSRDEATLIVPGEFFNLRTRLFATEVIEKGLKERGVSWFIDYLQSPISEGFGSKTWNSRLMVESKSVDCLHSKTDLEKYMVVSLAATQRQPKMPAKSWMPRKQQGAVAVYP